MSFALKLLTALVCLALPFFAAPVLADVGKPVYVACWAHQSDKNRVMWTAPFVANNNEIDAAKEQFAGYIVKAGYVKNLSAVSTSCVWNKKSEKTVADINAIKAQFNYSTDIGVNFIYKPFSQVSAGKQLHVQCEVYKTAASCTAYGRAFEQGNRGLDKDDTQAAAYYQMACDMGDAVGCVYLGILRDEGRGGPVDMGQALQLYDKACKANNLFGCYREGVALVNHAKTPEDVTRGLALLQAACDKDFAAACGSLGVYYHTGKGVAVDPKRAFDNYTKSCTLGNQTACRNLEKLKTKYPDIS
ncbi:sel1 repeat family protein [Asticcacaulis biprosthecium C19]|uniref:Sel1 repeat family protein n=1 Tax=Asticcacaulis biprosthecium C19 TaxID=715226 RepID=F4QU77_9CAUL|nr:tetratricopeptide repeat protein [Asticcacaulis biprosthecium]EGF89377.1 sel1 repeat family protein [Asticcacaulis biprosthecium C19]